MVPRSLETPHLLALQSMGHSMPCDSVVAAILEVDGMVEALHQHFQLQLC